MQRPSQQALGQHRVQVREQQRLDIAEDTHAVTLAAVQELLRIGAVTSRLRLDVIQLPDQRDETRGELLRPSSVLGQRLQRIVEIVVPENSFQATAGTAAASPPRRPRRSRVVHKLSGSRCSPRAVVAAMARIAHKKARRPFLAIIRSSQRTL